MALTNDRYQYQPLNETNREFRVLRLLPAQPHEQGERGLIMFEIMTISLNDKPEYTALSYCWGQEAAVHDISLNGHRFAVRPNLYEYLKILVEEAPTKPIFIDAICLNQDDLDERSSQVRLMGDIYRSAALVVAWVGSCPEVEEAHFVSLLSRTRGPC